MKTEQRGANLRTYIYGIVGASVFVGVGIITVLALLPHNKLVVFSIYRQVAFILTAIVAAALVRAETQRRHKMLFLLFVFLGIQQILDIAYHIVPQILFADNRFAGVQYYQYVTGGFGLFVQSVCLVGAGMLMNTRMPTVKTMLTACIICSAPLVMMLHPTLTNPRYLYTTPEITDFRIVDRAWIETFAMTKQVPTPEVLAERISLSRWDGKVRTGEMGFEEKIRRVRELEPYLFGNNYNMLVFKPLNEAWWQMSLLCAVVLLLLIASWFVGDSPSGVYFERMSVLLLCFSVFEVFHYSTYANLRNYEEYLNYFNSGAFLSLLTVVAITVLLLQRLRFILSHEGQYYESRMVLSPIRVTRWRDSFDNFIIQKFFKQNPYRKRFLTKTPPQ